MARLEIEPRQSSRLEWVDIAKAIGIILVVHGHTVRGLWNADILPRSEWGQLSDEWIYSFHMPLFFVLSGFFAERSVRRPLRDSLLTKVRIIVYPYVIWSVLQHVIQYAAGASANNPVQLEGMWRFIYLPPMQFWFLYTLFIVSIIYDLGLRILGSRSIVFALCIVLFILRQSGVASFGSWWVANIALIYLGYFSLGAVAFPWACAMAERSSKAILSITAITALLVTACLFASDEMISIISPLAAVLGTLMSISLAQVLARTRSATLFARLGQASMLIFVAHTIVSAGVRIFLLKVLKISDPIVHLALGDTLGLAAPFGLFLVSTRFTWLQRLYRL